jgi:hypothetical protein
MNVLITKSNAERIVKQMNLSKIDIKKFKDEMKFKWFNNWELKKLKAFSMLYSNPELFLSYYIPLVPRENENQFVFKSSSSAYHSNFQCEKLNSDFKNIKIPIEIINRNLEEEFIQFCIKNDNLRNKYNDQFILRLKWRFKITSDPTVIYENSGIDSFNNLNLVALEKEIEEKLFEVENLMASSVSHKEVISNFGNQSFNYKNPENIELRRLSISIKKEEVISILKYFELEIKQNLMKLFQQYYRIQNNRNLKFESDILTKLGFKQCIKCTSFSNSVSFESLIGTNSSNDLI